MTGPGHKTTPSDTLKSRACAAFFCVFRADAPRDTQVRLRADRHRIDVWPSTRVIDQPRHIARHALLPGLHLARRLRHPC
jgi:hypothetical protein